MSLDIDFLFIKISLQTDLFRNEEFEFYQLTELYDDKINFLNKELIENGLIQEGESIEDVDEETNKIIEINTGIDLQNDLIPELKNIVNKYEDEKHLSNWK